MADYMNPSDAGHKGPITEYLIPLKNRLLETV